MEFLQGFREWWQHVKEQWKKATENYKQLREAWTEAFLKGTNKDKKEET